jgi:hypothetical protein
MENENAQTLAEKIASLLQAETPKNADLHSLQSSLERINRRLDRIESQNLFQNPKSESLKSKSNIRAGKNSPVSKNSPTK